MRRRQPVRAAFAALALLVQLVVPVAHGFVFPEELPISAGAASASPAHASLASVHDSLLCPACIALHQASSGIGRTAAVHALALPGAPIARCGEPALALPRTPDLAAAAPRAPPIRPLAFA